MKTATETIREELYKVQNAMQECLAEDGHVRTAYRYRYQLLMKQEANLREALSFMVGARQHGRKA